MNHPRERGENGDRNRFFANALPSSIPTILAPPMFDGKQVRVARMANQLFKLGNSIRRGTGILSVFFGHGQDARATLTPTP